MPLQRFQSSHGELNVIRVARMNPIQIKRGDWRAMQNGADSADHKEIHTLRHQGFAEWTKNQASDSSPRNFGIDCTVYCSVSNRSRGLRDSIHRISVRSTPS